MNKHNSFSILGYFFTLIPLTLYGLWIYAINQVDDHMESVALYKAYLDPILQGRYDASYAGLLCSLLALVALIFGLKAKGIGWKTANIFCFILASLLFILYSFSLM